jgi:hypothetical protein
MQTLYGSDLARLPSRTALVIAGGAFTPQIEAISLNNVERIEVMRGAAPRPSITARLRSPARLT